MAFCGKCGAQVSDDLKFCPGCGAPVEETTSQQPQPNFQQSSQNYQQPSARSVDPAQDAQQNKTTAVLAYIIFFIPLITGDHKKSPFVRYHANQGTVLFLAMIAFGIVYAILSAVLVSLLFSAGGWGLFSILTTILGLLWVVPAVFCVLGIVHAVKGEKKPLPLIGKINIIK